MSVTNSTMMTTESWFIPMDILMIVCTTFVMNLSILFLSLIVLDKTYHTVPMMLVANSCLSSFLFACSLFSLRVYTLVYDLKQIEYEDSLCTIRAYFLYVGVVIINDSFLIQAIYRYVIVVYPNRLFLQSAKFQRLLICLTWIFSFLYPTAFIFSGAVQYNVDNQICQIPLKPTFAMLYTSFYVYNIPMIIIQLIYFKLVRYVREMSKRITPVNTLLRAQRELKMVQRTVILVGILLILGLPYGIFIYMSFFTSPPKYHYRIAYLFVDVSLVILMIALLKFTDPLKVALMKKLRRRPNRVVEIVV